MQKSKIILLILVALLMAFGASFVANKTMSKQLKANSMEFQGKTINVVIAATDVAYGQVLQQENLEFKKIPEQLMTEEIFLRIEDVIGKVAKGEIFQGEAIVSKRLAEHNQGTILAALVNQNMRAVSVRVDDVIGVAGFLLPGNRVDILSSRMDKRRSITRTVLQNIKVLAVDQTAEASKDKPLLVRAVTLEVSPKDSEALFQAIQEGSIHLTLRNPIDSSKNTVAKADVLEQPLPKAKVTPKSKPRPKRKKKRSKKDDLALEAYVDSILGLPVKQAMQKPKSVNTVSTNVVIEPKPVLDLAVKPAPTRTSTVTVIRGVTQRDVILKNNEVTQ